MPTVDMTKSAVAQARYVRSSARKARLVADLIRGERVNDALATLAYSTRSAAVPMRKVLQSAIANGDHNHGLEIRDMVVARVTVDEGPTIKRFRPRAQGRATPIMKRTCHITIAVAETEQ